MQMTYDELRALLGAVVDSFKDEPINAPWSGCIDRKLFERARNAAAQAQQFSAQPDEFNGTPMKTIPHPDDFNLIELIKRLSKALDLTLNPMLSADKPRTRGYVLMVFPLNAKKGDVHFSANIAREHVMQLMKDQVEKFAEFNSEG
jgi:hypothetical protein